MFLLFACLTGKAYPFMFRFIYSFFAGISFSFFFLFFSQNFQNICTHAPQVYLNYGLDGKQKLIKNFERA